MSLASPYQEHYYIADGETTRFSFGEYFSAPTSANVKCIIYFENGTSCVPSFNADITTGYIDIIALTTPDGQVLNAPPAGSSVRVFRDTPEQQNVTASQLQNYTAKQLEKIFDSIVAMIQENTYTTEHKTLRLTETQRDVFLAFLKEANDDALLYWDNETKTIVPTDFVRQDVVRTSGGLFFRMKHDAELRPYLEWSRNGQTDWHSLNYWDAKDIADEAKTTADAAYDLASTVQDGLSSHTSNLNNPHQTSLGNLTDTDFTNLSAGNFIMFDGSKWKNVYSSATASWGTLLGNITDQTDLMNKFTEYVRTDGTSVMTAPLLMRATDDFKCAIAPYWDGVGFFKLNDNNSVTLMASIEYNSGFEPATTNTYNIGALTRKWKNLYLSGKAYMSVINNGYDIAVPVTNSADTLALKSEVDLAANSGDQLTEKGVWYAKMYSATVAPSAEDGTNYADFSQTDGQGNPIIVIYKRQNGAWVQDQTITPPAEYNGYVPVTSKIWDIVEQAGQQGGKVLWSHNQKTFTPSPLIISFEDIEVTGESTVIMPANPTDNSIPSKKYIDDLIANLDVPELFDWKWKDCTTSRTAWALSDGNWVTDKSDAYQHLVDDVENKATSSVWGWRKAKTGGGYDYMYTESQDPSVGDPVYQSISDGASLWVFYAGVVDSVSMQSGHVHDITVGSNTYSTFSSTAQTRKLGSTETIAGTTIQFYLADDGHKICPASQESNVTAIYNATGVAWYYIIDTTNQRFKLPRSKHERYGDRPVVGNGTTLGLTDGTHNFGVANQNNTAALMLSSVMYGQPVDTSSHTTTNNNGAYGITTDATKSGIISTPVEDTDQYKYLYFYVGN